MSIAIASAASQLDASHSMLSLCQLEREPHALGSQLGAHEAQLVQHAYANFRIFLDASSAIGASHKIEQLRAPLAGISTALPQLVDSCERFLSRTTAWRRERKLTKSLVEHQAQLLETLELPQLMETCVKNALYDEALNIDQYARSLHSRLAHLPLLSQLVAELDQINRTLVHQLLHTLQVQSHSCVGPAILRRARFNVIIIPQRFIVLRRAHCHCPHACVLSASLVAFGP